MLTRRIVQAVFLAVVLIGVFVMGADCEHWCPFGGVEAMYTYVQEGNMVCSLGTSNFFALGGVLLLTLLARRAFCGYLCPIGTISDWVHAAARKLHLPSLRVPSWLDRGLSLLKYAVLAIVLWLTWQAGELIFRGFDPCYALISRHGPDITVWTYVTAGAVVAASLIVILPFCRWLCPLAAVMSPFSRFGLARVHRHEASCRGCGACSKHCPVDIPVDQLREVTAARCLSCLQCIDHCPDRASALSWGPPRLPQIRWPRIVLVGMLLFSVTATVAGAYFFPLPSFVKEFGEPPALVDQAEMQVNDFGCRGRANLLCYFLERDDMFALDGFLRVEAWPSRGAARVCVTFDPQQIDAQQVKSAIVEPYYDVLIDQWRMSPFTIVGYDPLDDLLDE